MHFTSTVCLWSPAHSSSLLPLSAFYLHIIQWSERWISSLKCFLCLCFLYRSRRLVSSFLRQIPVVRGRPGETHQNHSCCHTGPIWELWLADSLPVDVQWHRTQLETTPAGRQPWGKSSSVINHKQSEVYPQGGKGGQLPVESCPSTCPPPTTTRLLVQQPFHTFQLNNNSPKMNNCKCNHMSILEEIMIQETVLLCIWHPACTSFLERHCKQYKWLKCYYMKVHIIRIL